MLAQPLELSANFGLFGRRIERAFLCGHALQHAANSLLHCARLGAKGGILRLAKPAVPAHIDRPFRARWIISVKRKLGLFATALAVFSRAPRTPAGSDDVKGPSSSTCRKLSEHSPLDAQRTLNNEVLEIVRHQGVVPGSRAHFDDRFAFDRGSYGIAALASAHKSYEHRPASLHVTPQLGSLRAGRVTRSRVHFQPLSSGIHRDKPGA